MAYVDVVGDIVCFVKNWLNGGIYYINYIIFIYVWYDICLNFICLDSILYIFVYFFWYRRVMYKVVWLID